MKKDKKEKPLSRYSIAGSELIEKSINEFDFGDVSDFEKRRQVIKSLKGEKKIR